MRDERRDDTARTADGEPPATGEERGTTRRNLVIGGAAAVAAGGVVAAGAAIVSGGAAATAQADEPATTTTATASTPMGPSTGVGAESYTLTVNGEDHQVKAAPQTPLLYVLRNEVGVKGPKFGCGLSQCGACAVLVDGHEVRSCITPVSAAPGHEITTLDGLAAAYHGTSATGEDGETKLHPLQQAWIDEQVPQCGYCQNGMLIQAASLLSTNPSPSEDEIIAGMDGHLCRCGTYNGIVRAIKRASKEMSA
jgi:aerobic-type carbon monoxide dehydrogenase small subunit (CoxS/CutS family)